jgi:hypothetical protein
MRDFEDSSFQYMFGKPVLFFHVLSLGAVLHSHEGTELISVHQSKAIPLQALTGPDGSRRLRLPDFKTIGT